jgi:hypothetical protein
LTISLFTWWEISISWSITFLIVIGVYLYGSSKTGQRGDAEKEKGKRLEIEETSVAHRIERKARVIKVIKDFTFVWILLGLLVFYIFSVKLGTGRFSELVFALGNIFVEALLLFYLFRNRDKSRARS